MTDAGWTSEKPTEAGWYWFRDLSRPYEDEREPYVVKVRQYAQHLAVGNCRLEGAPYGRGEWLGPITPDDRQQGRVEGLREAAAIICEFCADSDYWEPMSNSGYHSGVNGFGLRPCKAERLHERIAEINTQAAQDE